MNTRNGTVDIMRYLAAVGIVLFHVRAPYISITYSALPLFTIYLAFFSITPGTTTARLVRRLWHLLRLWLIWSGIYGGLKIAEAVVDGQPIASEFLPWMLMTGPALHLWFLPFAVFLVVLGFFISRVLPMTPGPEGFLFLVGAGTILVALWLNTTGEKPIPFGQWIYVWPAAAFGFVAAMMNQNSRFWLTPVFAGAVTLIGFSVGAGASVFQFFGASLVAVASFLVVTPSTHLSETLRDLSLGVYFIHPAVVALLLRLPELEPQGLLFVALAVVISSLLSLLLLNRWGRVVIGA